MVKLSLIRTDLKKEEEGVWRSYTIPGVDTPIECLIARVGNKGYNQEVERLTQKWLDENESEKDSPGHRISAEAMEDIYLQAMSKYVLLDWKNADDEDGNPIKYTPEEGLKVLRETEFHDFQTWLYLQAGSRGNYRKEAQKEAVKNSQRSSNGSTSGDHTSDGSKPGQSADES